MLNFRIEGMEELKKSLDKLGTVQKRHVTPAVRKAIRIPLQEARKNAPYLTGNLKRGIITVGERSRYKAKKVYRIVFDRKMNDVFQKKQKDGKIAYYPVSQEYGFWTRSDSKHRRYIPGLAFVRKAMDGRSSEFYKVIIITMKKKIDAEIAKKGLR